MPPTQIVNFLPPAYITNINNALTTKIIQNNSTITSATGYNATYIWNVTADEQVLTIQSGAANGSYIILQDPNYTWNSQTTGPAISFDSGTTTGIVTIGNNASDLSSLVGSTIRFVYNSITNVWNSTIAPATTDNPLHGWWRNVAKSLLLSGATAAQTEGNEPLPSGYQTTADDNFANVSYYYLDCISMYPQVKLTSYGGTYDSVFGALQFESVYDILNDGGQITLAYPGVFGTQSFSFETFNEAISLFTPNTLTLQSNGTQLFGSFGNITDPTFILATTFNFNQASCLMQKMDTPPIIRPYSNNEVAFSDVQDPVNMFKYFAKLISEKGMAQVNLRQAIDQWYPGYYTQQSILQSYLDGKTIDYDIHHIVKSTTTQYTPADAYTGGAGVFGYGNLTGATKIFLGKDHLVTNGSSISMTGFSGEWSVLNGDYTNDVIYDAHWNNQSTGHFDCNNDEIVANLTGSFYNSANYFVLRLDTSSLTGINTGAYNGWATDYTLSTPIVSVTHHVTSAMSYHEFIAALKAYILEVYGTQEHTYLNVLLNEDESGRVADDWESFSEYFNSSFMQGWTLGQGYSLYYNSSYSPDYNVIYGDHYDVTNTLLTYVTGSATGGYSIAALNYLDPNETYNVYYAFDGEYSTGNTGSTLEVCGQEQQYWGEIAGAMNFSVSGLTGGSVLVCTGAPYGGGGAIDKTVWNILGAVNTLNGDEDSAYNFFIYGLVRSELTPNKKIGYIYTSNSTPFNSDDDNKWFTSDGSSSWNVWANKDILQNAPDKFANGVRAAPMVPVMKYFNAQQIDGIILDNRTNGGGETNWFEQFFGGDRLKISDKYFYLNSQNGLSPTLNIETPFQYYQSLNTTGSDNYLHPSFLESVQGYGPGSVYHGSPQTGANIVFLQGEASYSAGNLRLWNMLGDNLDGDIGANTRVKVLGCAKGYFASFSGNGYYIPAPYISDSVRGGNPFYYTAVTPEGTCPSIKLSSGASEPVLTPTNQINEYTAISPMTTNTGAFSNSLGNPFPMGMEESVYPDFGFCQNNKPRLPGDTRQQTPDPTISGTWRDGWLEAAIGEAVYGTW